MYTPFPTLTGCSDVTDDGFVLETCWIKDGGMDYLAGLILSDRHAKVYNEENCR